MARGSSVMMDYVESHFFPYLIGLKLSTITLTNNAFSSVAF